MGEYVFDFQKLSDDYLIENQGTNDSSLNTGLNIHGANEMYVDLSQHIDSSVNNLTQRIENVSTYVKDVSTRLDTSVNELTQRIVDVSTYVKDVSTRLDTSVNNLTQRIADVSAYAKDVSTRLDVSTSKIHANAGFNAGNLTEEGWYDQVNSGRPEGTESDEMYLLYQSNYGTASRYQICFSKKNPGRTYERIGYRNGTEFVWGSWTEVSRDDYSLQHSSAIGQSLYTHSADITYNNWNGMEPGSLDYGYFEDSTNNLSQVYSGYGEIVVQNIHLYKQVHLKPNDIIKLRTFFRSHDDIPNYKYDTNVYLYVSNSESAGHTIDKLKSDYIKIHSLGSYDIATYPGSLTAVRNDFFTESSEYGWHYIKANVEVEGDYYLHLEGSF